MRLVNRSRPQLEALENRQLLAGDPLAGFPLPFQLDFNRPKQGLLERDGSGTGFTWAIPNAAGDEYNPGAIDLRMGAGILRIYSSGNASTGGMFDSDNTIKNVLTTNFGASSKPWVMYTRLNGPPTDIDQPHEQMGLFFGPDQDNYVKLVVAAENGQVGLQFVDEQKFKTGYRHYLPQTVYNIGSLASVGTIDLYLSGDPAARTIRGLYRINEGPVKELSNALVLDPEKAGAFFAFAPHAGLMVQHKNNGPGISMTVEQFGIKRGVLTGEPDSNTNGRISTGSRRVFNDVRGGTGGQQIGVSVRNDGNGPLTISGLNVTGTDASMFSASIVGNAPQTIQPGQSASLKLTFTAPSETSLGIKTASLAISSNDPSTPVKNVALRGIATAGTGGTNEPSFQRLMDLFQIPINVGDTTPDDVFLNDPPATPNDEVSISQFRKAGSGDVTIQPISVFGVASTPVALRFGTYEPGSPSDITELFTIATADAQTVNPVPVGTSSFDPGGAAFSLYTVWPGFKNSDNSIRVTYQEDQFNAFDAGDKRHIRFYPYKNSDGSVLANTYILAVEEIDAAKDNQDIVAIISNVIPAGAGAEIGTENLDGWPAPDRLVFNKFVAGDPAFPSTAAHTQAKVRVRNTGTSSLAISSIVPSGPFSVLSNTGAQNIAPGKFSDVLVQFNGGSTSGLKTGTVTISSNDSDEPVKIINLAGYHQPKPEGNVEPTLAQTVNTLFGFATNVGTPAQLDTDGKRTAVGDEVLSNYWKRSNTSLPVTVKQISSFHMQGTTAVFNWHSQGSSSLKKLFTTATVDAQSLYPREEGNLGAYATASFTPSGSTAFGFNIDGAGGEWSDDTKNNQEQSGGGWGHHVRFYPLKNADNAVVADAYLMVMDYSGINYDYNDNVYLITNIKPA